MFFNNSQWRKIVRILNGKLGERWRGICLKFLEEKTGDLHLISGIGVMKGPGSFTGLRIGLTVVNTLADSLNIPIVGAMSDNWRDLALGKLRSGENEKIVMPEYGAAANITAPRK